MCNYDWSVVLHIDKFSPIIIFLSTKIVNGFKYNFRVT